MLVSWCASLPSILSRASLGLATLTLTLALPGCKDDDDSGDEGVGDASGGMCPECPPGQEVYLCIIDGKEKQRRFDDFAQAQASCGLILGDGVVGNGPIPCDNHTPDPSVPWTPGSFVSYDEHSRTYEIDRQFLLDVLTDPNQLLLDRSRLEWRGDHFEFENVAQGDLAALLGFVDGDALSELNGYPLSTMGEITEAYEVLRDERSFTVVIVRDQATTKLAYRIVDGE